ncbi:hypothetical protein HPP92_013471 [Vanilla planifolia]|uniref:Uncharacterized protein n=1 Tax=Vanilla planifolia TaxID=51239 RepID=A0A835QNH0_VANPL|nr:hypothetical protein HPP92_013471 [Vanilla planifolia]
MSIWSVVRFAPSELKKLHSIFWTESETLGPALVSRRTHAVRTVEKKNENENGEVISEAVGAASSDGATSARVRRARRWGGPLRTSPSAPAALPFRTYCQRVAPYANEDHVRNRIPRDPLNLQTNAHCPMLIVQCSSLCSSPQVTYH